MTPGVLQLYRKRSANFSFEREILQEFILQQAMLVAKNRKTFRLAVESRDRISHIPRYMQCIPDSITDVGTMLKVTLTKLHTHYRSMFETSIRLAENIETCVDVDSQKYTSNRSDVFKWMKKTLDSSDGSCIPDSESHPLVTYFLHDLGANYDVQIRGRTTFNFVFKNFQRHRRVSKNSQPEVQISKLKKQVQSLQQELQQVHALREEFDLFKEDNKNKKKKTKRGASSHKQDKDRAKRNKQT